MSNNENNSETHFVERHPDADKPSRFSVRKLLFILLLVGLVAAAAVWWWRKAQSQSVLQAEIDAIHARGEPVTVGEITFFRQGQLPPEQNAFTLYKQAAERFDTFAATESDRAATEPEQADVVWALATPGKCSTCRREHADGQAPLRALIDYPVWRREHADEASAFLTACKPALALVRQARGMDGVPLHDPDNDRPAQSALDELFSPRLPYVLLAARLSSLAAVMAHDAGNDRDAFEHLLDIWQIRDLLGEHPTFITVLIQANVTGMAAACMEQIVPMLRIGPGPDEVHAADVLALAERLIQSDAPLDVARKADIGERVYLYEMARASWGETNTSGWSLNRSARDMVLAAMLRAYPQGDEWIGSRYIGGGEPAESSTEKVSVWRWAMGLEAAAMTQGELLVELGASTRHRGRVVAYRGLATQRMAGLALLMRLHDVETGQPVATLDDLVPRYVDTLPEDPFSPTGDPPRLLADDPHPRLYSLNHDQQDDGGDLTKSPDGIFTRDPRDWPYFLNDTRDQAEGRDDQPPPPANPADSGQYR